MYIHSQYHCITPRARPTIIKRKAANKRTNKNKKPTLQKKKKKKKRNSQRQYFSKQSPNGSGDQGPVPGHVIPKT